MKTLEPSAAYASAHAAPIPPDAPVTRTRLPARPVSTGASLRLLEVRDDGAGERVAVRLAHVGRQRDVVVRAVLPVVELAARARRGRDLDVALREEEAAAGGAAARHPIRRGEAVPDDVGAHRDALHEER